MAVTPDSIRRRVETDLIDDDLEALIDDAYGEIRSRWGPDRSDADPPAPITVTLDGYRRRRLDLTRPLDDEEDVTVTEFDQAGFVSGATETELAADDFRILNGGRTLERVVGGTNSRYRWAKRVDVTYVPVSDQAQRDEVVVKLVLAAVAYEGVSESEVGDTRTRHGDYQAEREKLIGSLSPRKGLLFA